MDLKATIRRCLESCNPPVIVYSEDSEGGYHKISNGVVADVEFATEQLQSVLEPYLKNEEEQNEIINLKSDNAYLRGEVSAYEKFLLRNGIIADAED